MSIRGLSLATELGVGLNYQMTDRFSVAADVTWFDWSRAFRRTRLQLNHSDNPSAPRVIKATTPNQFRDQIAVSIGGEYRWSEALSLRGGTAYGRNPIPSEALTPLFGVNSEYHAAAGFVYTFAKVWNFHGGVFYVFPVAQKYENKDLPLGKVGQVRSEVWDINFSIERDW